MPFLKCESLKLKFRVLLAGHSVAIVTYCVTKIVPTRSSVIRQFFDTMIVASIDKEWKVLETVLSHLNLLRNCAKNTRKVGAWRNLWAWIHSWPRMQCVANYTLALENARFGIVNTRYYVKLALFHRVTSFDLVQFLLTPSRVNKISRRKVSLLTLRTKCLLSSVTTNKVGVGGDEKRKPVSFKATTSFLHNKFLAILSLPTVLKQDSNNNLSQPS